jgi:hypothetical protein
VAHEHGECRGRSARESARYTPELVKLIGKAITGGPCRGVLGSLVAVAEAKVLPQPEEPSEIQRREHEVTHLPFASWCGHCVAAKAKDQPHCRLAERGGEEVPIVEMDYGHLRTDDERDRLVAILVAALKFCGYTFAAVCSCKGPKDEAVVAGICRFLIEAGCSGLLRLRTDQEPAIEAMAQRVAAVRSPAQTIIEVTPVGSSSSLGSAERKVQTIGGQVRVLRLAFEAQWHVKVLAVSPVFKYVVRHAAWLLNRFQPTRGQTPYMKVYKHEYRREVCNFGEPVMLRVSDLKDQGKLEPRWSVGVWVGKAGDSDEHMVAMTGGVAMGRSVRRMAPGEAPIDLVKKVMWSDMVGEPMLEDEEKPAVGAGEKVCRRITGKTTPQVPTQAVEPELALAERVEPGGRTFQSEALLPERGAERVIGERGGHAPRRYAAAEEKLRGGFATERSRELKRFIDETGATPGCAGCKYCRWTPDQPERWQSQVHSTGCRKRRAEWKEATAAGAVREPLKKEEKKIEDKKEIDVDHE